jgi:predicted nuclease of predicted toxin-antitoxin system
VKLLFDENLSPRLARLLADLYPGSVHVHHIGFGAAHDAALWHYAEQHGFVIVSKDADFSERSLRLGPPPKVVWVRRGNCSTRDIETLLRRHYDVLLQFASDSEAGVLEII